MLPLPDGPVVGSWDLTSVCAKAQAAARSASQAVLNPQSPVLMHEPSSAVSLHAGQIKDVQASAAWEEELLVLEAEVRQGKDLQGTPFLFLEFCQHLG